MFFLINGWDEIRLGLVDIDDGAALAEAEGKLRQFFQTNLAEYCQINGANVYDERVFELCSLNALRRRLKQPEDSLEGTGFPGFMAALNTLTKPNINCTAILASITGSNDLVGDLLDLLGQ